MSSNICVCIEGQLRGSKTCGPTIKKHLIDKLDADLYFCLQNYSNHNQLGLKDYGSCIEYHIYDNPEPDFSLIFNNLCESYNLPKDTWKANFHFIKDENWTLGYNRPGTCIRRMYNRMLIYEMLKHKSYEWYILSRSDLFFIDDFFDISFFDPNFLHYCERGGWGGINNNLLVFHRDLFDKVLLYITNFFDMKLLMCYKSQQIFTAINEEKFFMLNMLINSVPIKHIPLRWFISADEGDISTWADIRKDSEGRLYKYDYDHDACIDYINRKQFNEHNKFI